MGDYVRWVWRKAEATSLARFVTPECAAGVVDRITLPEGRSVHDAVRAGEREAVARALYETIASLEIDYDIESYTPDGQHSQVVRSPPEIRGRRRATCLDLALLFAGLALDLTLRPVVIVLDGHALVAVLNVNYGLEIDPTLDKSILLDWIRQDPQTLIPIESTGAARGEGLRLDFDAARRAGEEAIEQRQLLFAIDPYRLHREQGLEPASCTAPRRPWLVPGVAGALAVGGLVSWWLYDPVPVFGTGVEGVVVPAVPDADGVAGWVAEGLQAAAEDERTLVDVRECGLVARLEAWGPDQADRVDLTDPGNPSNVDIVLTGSVVPTSLTSEELFVTLGVEPFSAVLSGAADPILLTLGSSPAAVDVDRDPLVVFPELAVLPAVALGLRQLELGSDQGLEEADCLFDLADQHLADSSSDRVQRYRAVIAVLAANGHILEASGSPEDQEAAHLLRAQSRLAQAEEYVDDPGDRAVVHANGMATQVLAVITDEGALAPKVDQADLDALLASLDQTARMASGESAPAYIAMRSLSAKLLLASYRRDGDLALLNRVIALTEDALRKGEEITGLEGQRQVAEVYEVRGLARMVAGEPTQAILEFEEAASHAGGALRNEYLLHVAAARILRCAEGDRAAIEEILRDTSLYLDNHDSEALSGRRDETEEIADRRCPA